MWIHFTCLTGTSQIWKDKILMSPNSSEFELKMTTEEWKIQGKETQGLTQLEEWHNKATWTKVKTTNKNKQEVEQHKDKRKSKRKNTFMKRHETGKRSMLQWKWKQQNVGTTKWNLSVHKHRGSDNVQRPQIVLFQLRKLSVWPL